MRRGWRHRGKAALSLSERLSESSQCSFSGKTEVAYVAQKSTH